MLKQTGTTENEITKASGKSQYNVHSFCNTLLSEDISKNFCQPPPQGGPPHGWPDNGLPEEGAHHEAAVCMGKLV